MDYEDMFDLYGDDFDIPDEDFDNSFEDSDFSDLSGLPELFDLFDEDCGGDEDFDNSFDNSPEDPWYIFPGIFTEEDDDEEEDQEESDERLGHRHRLRGRFGRNEPLELSPAQMLEMMLCYVLPRQDVKKVSDALLAHFGGLKQVLMSNIDDFRHFPGLGESGAQWLDEICTMVRIFSRMRGSDSAKIANFRQLRGFARTLLDQYGVPCCLQLVTDGDDRLLYARPMGRDLRWGEPKHLGPAVEDAANALSENAYLLVFTPDPARHPTAYDQKKLRDYAMLMQHSECALRDVLFMNGDVCISLHRRGEMPEPTPCVYPLVAEDDKDAPLALPDLIVRSYPETDPFQSI